jgi:hypothetical protein
MTQFTSFVAVEERIVTTDGKPQRVEVPVEMPEGMSYEGVFGDQKNWLAAPHAGLTINAQMSTTSGGNKTGIISGVGGGIVGPAAGGGVGGGTFQGAAPSSHGAAPSSAARRTTMPVPVVGGPPIQPEIQKPVGERAILESKLSPTLLDAFDCWKKQRSDCKQAKDGTIELQVFLKEDTAAVIDQLKALGLSGAQERTKEKIIIGRLPLDKLTELAKMDAVIFLAPVRR